MRYVFLVKEDPSASVTCSKDRWGKTTGTTSLTCRVKFDGFGPTAIVRSAKLLIITKKQYGKHEDPRRASKPWLVLQDASGWYRALSTTVKCDDAVVNEANSYSEACKIADELNSVREVHET